jgi:hypothetical protein
MASGIRRAGEIRQTAVGICDNLPRSMALLFTSEHIRSKLVVLLIAN